MKKIQILALVIRGVQLKMKLSHILVLGLSVIWKWCGRAKIKGLLSIYAVFMP